MAALIDTELVTVEFIETITRTALIRIPKGTDVDDNKLTHYADNVSVERGFGVESEIIRHGPEKKIPLGSLGSIDGTYED